jgi:prepilin-type N-terminal cleavage/methylation domain-containing protein
MAPVGNISPGREENGGFTLLEILVVIVIIAILASMLLPVYAAFLSRMEETRCLANLRTLYLAGSGYLQANESWPQIDNKLITEDPKTYARLWVTALKPFGAPHSSWICPTLQKTFAFPMEAIDKDENYRIDFIGAGFDTNPLTPRISETFPWFKAGVHRRGNLVILANGTTTSLQDLTGATSGN